MRVQVLGRVRAWTDEEEEEVDLGPAGQRAVLGLLALTCGEAWSRADLIDAIWGESPPPTATNILQTRVKHLRRLVEPDRSRGGRGTILRTAGDGYVLHLPSDAVDVARFHDLVNAATEAQAQNDLVHSAALLDQALNIWHGPPLADIPELTSHPKVVRVNGARRSAFVRYGEAMIAIGSAAQALPVLEEAAAAQPLDEIMHCLLIRAYHATGHRAQAVAVYQLIRERLADELGLDPGPELADAHAGLLREPQRDGDVILPSSPHRTAPAPAQLPADIYGFTGRAAELSALDHWLDAAESGRQTGAPMVISAVTGTAGVGKTALAVHWAHRVRHRFADGQLYVDLRGYDADESVPVGDVLARFLAALGVSGKDIPLDTDERAARLRTQLADRRILLVLDNARSSEQVRPLLPGTATCMVVVTSRDSLPALVAVRGAHRIELDLLPPDDAITLLRRLIGARVSVAPDAAASLAAQCAYLPLALRIVAEMATSRPATRLAEVVEELSDEHRRLDLLDTGDDPRNAVETVFSWSYGALSGENGRAFRLFGIQVGADISARAYAALADCDPAEAGQLLRALGRAHLVATHGRDRYGTHDLLRAYAKRLNQAEDTDAARKAALTRLLDHYLSNAASAMDAMYPAERQYRPHVIRADATTPAAARAWLDAERHNLVAICVRAAEWPERAIQLSAVLNRYLEGDHHTDALTIHTAALISARHTRNRAAEAHCLTYLGSVYRMLGQYQQATEYYDQALEMHVGNGDLFGEARTESNLGIIDERLGQLDASTAHYERALVLFRRLGDKHGEATTLNNFAGVYFPAKGRHDLAAANYSRSRALYEELGDRVGEAIALSNLGAVEGHVGHYELAAEHHLQAVAVFRELGHRYGEASALNGLGDVLVRLGRHREAAAHHEHALAVFRELGHRYGEAAALNGLGEAQCAAGDYAAALAQHRAALALTQQTGDRDEEDRARNGLASAAGAQAVDSVQANAAS